MLHINNITIRNFRPYYGVKSFEFGKDEGLSIILGDNGIGKSSLIRALKFVLYDEFDNDSSFKIKNELNIIAWEEQTYDMYVALDFIYNEENYILKRSRAMKSILSEPKNDVDFISHVTLNKNGKIQSNEETERLLKNIIPKKISEYILFEGETISKYKDLLDNNKNQEIYDSIRKILGLTILENSQTDLEKQLERYESERFKLAKSQTSNEKLKEQLSRLEEEKTTLEEERNKATLNLKESQNQKTELEDVLKNNQRISDLINDRTKVETNQTNARKEIEDYKLSIKDLIKNYKIFSKDFIEDSLKNISPEIIMLIELQENNLNKTKNINLLKDLLDSENCDYCGNHMGEQEFETITNKILKLENDFLPLTDEEKDMLETHQSKTNRLNELLIEIPLVNNEIKDLEAKIQSRVILIDGYTKQIKSIKEQINNLGGTKDLEQVTKTYSTVEKNIGLFKEIIFNCNEKLKVIQKSIDKIINKNIIEIDLTSIDSKIKTTKQLITIFENAIDSFSNIMRIKVQDDATELFRQISDNDEYDRLEFDDHYGLKLIDKKNRVVPNISSGYMTLITISLIYGLHKNSSLTGTIVLDAPFSVLTDFHRDKIINAFQKLSPQVILLVYKDQIDIHKIREQMQGKLINEYEIFQDKNKPDYSYKTDIRRGEF